MEFYDDKYYNAVEAAESEGDEDYPFIEWHVDRVHDTIRGIGRTLTEVHDDVESDLTLLRNEYYDNDQAEDIQTCLELMERCEAILKLINYKGE